MRHVYTTIELASILTGSLIPAQATAWETRHGLFEEIFLVFLVLGTLVGAVVIAYMLYNAYKYRAGRPLDSKEEDDRPVLGELPVGSTGGKKLFVSFAISAVIVIGLVIWTYMALLYVEGVPHEEDIDDRLEIDVVGVQFAWDFTYPNDYEQRDELVVPEDEVVQISVTGQNVWHTFGSPELRVKADAIPGQTDTTWFRADEIEDGVEYETYEVWCYELCGVGHSYMTAEVIVVEQDMFDEWYEAQPDDDFETWFENRDAENDENDAENDENDANDENGENEGNDADAENDDQTAVERVAYP